MSWSVSATGKPAAVKASLTKQFESILASLAGNTELKHEHASAALTLEIIEGQLNFRITNELPGAVAVTANGHAYLNTTTKEGQRVVLHGETATHLDVHTVGDFVE